MWELACLRRGLHIQHFRWLIYRFHAGKPAPTDDPADQIIIVKNQIFAKERPDELTTASCPTVQIAA
jgi:hypothetical protein